MTREYYLRSLISDNGSLKDFAKTIGGIVRNLPLLMLILVYTGFMCWYGFKSGFLLTSNGVVVSIFIAHLFMDFSIIVLHHTRVMKRILRRH